MEPSEGPRVPPACSRGLSRAGQEGSAPRLERKGVHPPPLTPFPGSFQNTCGFKRLFLNDTAAKDSLA